jgi:nucleotide-binding universal stress UspA family protein
MTVIAGYDTHPQGRDAVALGASLARALGEPLLVASVYDDRDAIPRQHVAALRDWAETAAEQAVRDLGDEVEATAAPAPGRSPAHGLHDLAESENATAVVVGSSHRGAFGRVLAGNVASQLLSSSTCPVAVAPRGLAGDAVRPLQSIGVAFDGGAESWNALQVAAAFAAKAGATLTIIRALEPIVTLPETPVETEELLAAARARERLEVERAVESVSQELEPDAHLVVGDPVHVLEREAHDGLDLLVLGSRGFGAAKRVLLGSVSGELVRLAACATLVVPRGVRFDSSAGGLAARDEAAATGGGS